MTGNKRRGFTLIEVVAALTLLGAGLAILFAGYRQAVRLEASAADRAAAASIARSKLAEAQAGYETGSGGECPGRPDLGWRISWEPCPEPGLRRVVVTVTSPDYPQPIASAWGLTGNGP